MAPGIIFLTWTFVLIEFVDDDSAFGISAREDFDVDLLVVGVFGSEDVHELTGIAIDEGEPA